MSLHSVQDIARMLGQRAGQLAPELLPGGRKEGREWVCGSLHGGRGRGVSVCMAGHKAGIWADFQAGGGGDMLDLVAAVRCGGDKVEAIRWARGWLGLGPARGDGSRVAPPPPPPPRDEAAERAKAEKRRERGKGLWLAGEPILGTPAEAYLRGRGIDLAALGKAPGALRFNPKVWCAEREMEAPAMLAAIVAGAATIGVHRTYLAPDGRGGWRKAPIRSAKKVLGQFQGGAIPIWRGASDRPLREAPAGDTVAICEGIEDALTIAMHAGEWRVITCVSAGNMGGIDLPPAITEVVLCLDRDGENQAVKAARERAVRRYQAEGRLVREALPPEGFKDFNAWQMAQGAAERVA